MRAVVDTGVIVSALIRRDSVPGEILFALRQRRFEIVYTTAILIEIIDVLSRPKIRTKYQLQPQDAEAMINLIRQRGYLVSPLQRITYCRDPKDNKFLEAALAGKANWLVCGDADLLDMVIFQTIPILRPTEFLAKLKK